jgi:putative DNA primase/helicase
MPPDSFFASQRGNMALRYATECGWAVLPLWWIIPEGFCACPKSNGRNHKPGKHPIGRLVRNGYKNATKDPDQITEWWGQYPEANIGVAMGNISGIFAIDLDGEKGHKVFADLLRLNSPEGLKTLVQQSGRGPDGHHVFFRMPSGKGIGRVLRKDLGIDIIGNGGYIVVAPSNHISGGIYQWSHLFPISDCEQWLGDWVASLSNNFSAVAHHSPKIAPLNLAGTPPSPCRHIKRLADVALQPEPGPIWCEYEDAMFRSALDYRDANGSRVWDPDAGYEIWGKVAAAIASLGWGSKGEDIFVYWSAQATVEGLFPGDEECRKQVRSYKRGRERGCITEATIYGAALNAGWKQPPIEIVAKQFNSHEPNGHSAKADEQPNTDKRASGEAAPNQFKQLPTIHVIGGGLSDNATAGEDAIIAADHLIYRRGTMLMRPIVQEVDATHGRRTKVAQLVPVTQPYMSDLLCKSAKWTRYDLRQKKRVQIDPPVDVAQLILHRSGEWKFKEIIGVMTTPTLRPDGSLLVRPGYDSATRLVLMEPPLMPAIPCNPTREEAISALTLLDGLLDEFPYADKPSRTVALSALITPVVRGAFSVTPMHAACAPAAGTGKSYLFDIAAAISTGQPCPVMAAGRDEEETEKRLGAALLAGQSIINIDNVNGNLGGDALCQIIERPLVEIRRLGKSELVRIECRTTVFATGNNLHFIGDMTRRVLTSMLDAYQERPELRQFKHDPVAEILTERGRYVAAVLTLVRAYIVAGRPRVVPRLTSFEGWLPGIERSTNKYR